MYVYTYASINKSILRGRNGDCAVVSPSRLDQLLRSHLFLPSFSILIQKTKKPNSVVFEEKSAVDMPASEFCHELARGNIVSTLSLPEEGILRSMTFLTSIASYFDLSQFEKYATPMVVKFKTFDDAETSYFKGNSLIKTGNSEDVSFSTFLKITDHSGMGAVRIELFYPNGTQFPGVLFPQSEIFIRENEKWVSQYYDINGELKKFDTDIEMTGEGIKTIKFNRRKWDGVTEYASLKKTSDGKVALQVEDDYLKTFGRSQIFFSQYEQLNQNQFNHEFQKFKIAMPLPHPSSENYFAKVANSE